MQRKWDAEELESLEQAIRMLVDNGYSYGDGTPSFLLVPSLTQGEVGNA